MTTPVVLEVPFAGGIDESTRDELVEAGSFTRLENVRQDKRGSVNKRPAYESLGNTRLDDSTRTEGRRILANDDQICTVDNEQIDVYVPSLERFVPRSRVPEVGWTSFDTPTIGLDLNVPSYVADVAYVNGFIAIAQISAGSGSSSRDCYVSILDAETKAVVDGPTLVTGNTANSEYCLATFGTTLVLCSIITAADRIYVNYIDTASAATLAQGWDQLTFIDAPDLSGQLATACMPTQTDRFAIAYDVGSGTDRVVVKTIGATGVIETRSIPTSSTTPDIDSIDLSEHGSTLWVCWALAGDVFAMGLDPADIDGTPIASESTVPLITGGFDSVSVATTDSGHCQIVGSVGGSITVVRVKPSGGEASREALATTYWNARALGRPFFHGDLVYQWVGSDKADDVALCEFTHPIGGQTGVAFLRPVLVPIVRGLRAAFFFQRCRTATIAADRFAFAFPVKRTGVVAGISAIEIDFVSSDRWDAAAYHRSTFLGGGVTTTFDGSYAVESCFVCAPPIPEVDASASGAMTFTNGGRRYVAVYVSADADGNLHVSGVSDPSAATGDITSKTVTVSVKPLSITARGNRAGHGVDVSVYLYATTDGGEPPYHLIKRRNNFPHTEFLDIEDDVADNTVSSGALLYGSGNLPGTVVDGQVGGPQDHRAPPGLRYLTVYNGMLVGATDSEVWHTSQPVYGEAPWWSPVFSQQIDGKITGLFVLDGTLYALTRTSVYAMSGDPPNDAGTTGGLSAPRKLAIDRGCINPRSVVSTSEGAFFQSSRTIELFRQGAIEPIGDLVQDTLASYPFITSAVFDPRRGLVRFSLAISLDSDNLVTQYLVDPPDGEDPYEHISGGGVDLIFDLVLGAWVSIDTKTGSTSNEASQHAALVVHNGEERYAWIGADGTVYVETEATRLDPGDTWVTQRAETGWVHIAGIQGEQLIDRLLLLARSVSDHDIAISLAFDYGEYGTPKVFTSDQITTLARAWLEREVTQATSQALRVLIEDGTPSGVGAEIGNGEGSSWIALSFAGQPHRGIKRTSGAQRGG